MSIKNNKLIFVGLVAALVACGTELPPENVYDAKDFSSVSGERVRCGHFNELKNPYFGDLHVHTVNSNDAWAFGVRVTPDDAYNYAFGGEVVLPLGDRADARKVQIDRPLDFAAVTDHGEFLGEQQICLDPNSGGYATTFCATFRQGDGRAPDLVKRIAAPFSWRDREVCGSDGKKCAEAAKPVWQANIATAEKWNDRSENCQRTTFVAYEYSSHRLGSNLHRNVIFRNAIVPPRPVSYLDATREWDLWRILKQRCKDNGSGCDVLAIPHNSNISNGRMFSVDYSGAYSKQAQAERAKLRMEIEPIIEIMQHKGDSECRNGISSVLGTTDELCDFEKFENLAFRTVAGSEEVGTCYDGPLQDCIPHIGPNCISARSYVRYALADGQQEQKRIGVNPFKFGISASTDTHNGTAGGVQEANFSGHLGNGDATAADRTNYSGEVAGNASNNPGGLIGIWAAENTRDALFQGMRDKEVFGTSGPRIKPRFFGGFDLPENLCSDPEIIEQAYRHGVPMGGDLSSAASAQMTPGFLALAQADAGSEKFPGLPLQRLQVIKVWKDGDGNYQQRIHDVAGNADNGASVDLDSCQPRGEGYQQLCSVWRDSEFDTAQSAAYYMRAVENPSCRYTTRQCLGLAEGERPESCDNDDLPKTIQERAWSSPIWYTAAAE